MAELTLTSPTPEPTKEQWLERFSARMLLRGGKNIGKERYAKQAAKRYWRDREQYDSPEDAADTDISYWE